jgi:nucleoid-associated protein YgaU
MPITPSSRHRLTPVHVARDAAGVPHPTIGIRHVAPPADATGMLHRVQAGDTLESLAAQYLGASDLWWRIADVNTRELAFALRPGATVRIPTSAAGTIVRTRSF